MTNTPQSPAPVRFWAWAALLSIVLASAVLRTRFVDVPLERDEGEYAYAGQLILHGLPPYANAYNMKMPGIYYQYAGVLAVFGESHQGVHWGLILINSISIVLVFLLGKKLFDDATGLIAAAAFALLSLSHQVLGFTANAEHFVLWPALLGLLLYLQALESGRRRTFFAAGFFLGLAFVTKQHGVFFPLFAGLYLILHDWKIDPQSWRESWRRLLALVVGGATPLVVIVLVLGLSGVLDKFWYWVFQYAAEYVSIYSPAVGITFLPGPLWCVMEPSLLFYGFAGLGLGLAPWWDREVRRRWVFLFGFLLFSFFSICPGWYFRDHYFILLAPALALLCAAGIRSVARLAEWANGRLVGLVAGASLTAAAVAFALHWEWAYYFEWTPNEVARKTYGVNPFPESLVIAEYLEKHTTPDERIAVIGSEPQIYFYAKRRSATGHIYTYALMEPQKYARRMQDEMIAEIEAARPDYVVFVNVYWSWLWDKTSDPHIFRWFETYQEQFDRVGLAIWDHQTARYEYYWGKAAEELAATPQGFWVAIWRRRR